MRNAGRGAETANKRQQHTGGKTEEEHDETERSARCVCVYVRGLGGVVKGADSVWRETDTVRER